MQCSSLYPGKLIVVEGIDGSGKTVQSGLLVTRLRSQGYKINTCDFPRYGTPDNPHPASYFVRKYLQKQEFGFTRGFGRAAHLNPRAISLMYALDRFDAAFCEEGEHNLWSLLREGNLVVSNRYTQSNIGHQAAKIDNQEERREFIKWLIRFEYEILRIPRPGLVILLNLDPEIAFTLKSKQRQHQGVAADAHEVDLAALKKASRAYIEAASMFPDTWVIVDVADKVHDSLDVLTGLHTKEVIHEKVWSHVKKFLDRA